jgi:hypothetical protein
MAMLLVLALLQAASQAPDIEIGAKIHARSVTIEKKGEAHLKVHTDPDAGGNIVDVQAPKANGSKTLKNVEISVRAEAHIADPGQNKAEVETPQPK